MENEDCLVPDVTVPRGDFEYAQSNKGRGKKKGPPVLVYIHVGPYTAGRKDEVSPAGLVAESLREGRERVVVAAVNYRL